MYHGDSFFTLSGSGQIGLFLLSAILFAGLIAGVFYLRLSLWAHVFTALILFWVFVWLSPQIYYLYYMTLLDGLPFQSVIHSPPKPVDIAKLLAFQASATLSAHGQSILGWSLILAPFAKRLRRNAAN